MIATGRVFNRLVEEWPAGGNVVVSRVAPPVFTSTKSSIVIRQDGETRGEDTELNTAYINVACWDVSLEKAKMLADKVREIVTAMDVGQYWYPKFDGPREQVQTLDASGSKLIYALEYSFDIDFN